MSPIYVKSLADLTTADRPTSRGPRVTAADLQAQLKLVGLPIGELEFVFAPPRKWRFDLCWPNHYLAFELEGVVYGDDYKLGGRHTSRKGFKADLEKYAMAAILGFRIIRALPGQVTSGVALKWCEAALWHGPRLHP